MKNYSFRCKGFLGWKERKGLLYLYKIGPAYEKFVYACFILFCLFAFNYYGNNSIAGGHREAP